MASDDGGAGFGGFVGHSSEDVSPDFRGGGFGIEAGDVHHSERSAAHGVDVAEGVGGGDGAVAVGVIDDGGEEV